MKMCFNYSRIALTWDLNNVNSKVFNKLNCLDVATETLLLVQMIHINGTFLSHD